MPEQARMAHRPAEDAAEHIAAPVVGGEDVVGNKKDGGAEMVGDNAVRGAQVAVGVGARALCDLFYERAEEVAGEVVMASAEKCGNPLQADAGVNRRLGQVAPPGLILAGTA